MVAKFEYAQAEEIREIFQAHGVRYLFLGKSGLILLGFPDTTQDADLYCDKTPENCAAIVPALVALGFELSEQDTSEILRGKDFVQLKNGPFDLDLVFSPDGIEHFEDAWRTRVVVEGFPVCHPRDIISSKIAANRAKDREALPRLRAFERWWLEQQRDRGR